MEINGKTRLCGLIGNPVEHTLSPLIHNTLAEKLGHNLVYLPFPVEEKHLEDAVAGAFGLNVLGLNVTVPYKSAVMPYLTEIDKLADEIGAVNTLVRSEEGYTGFNTDMPGLFRAMQSDGVKIDGESVIILGAGGAARAVAFLCASKGAKEIFLLNRSIEKANEVAAEVNALYGDKVCAMELNRFRELPKWRYLAIQCTSVGLYPNADAAVIEDEAFYEMIHTGYDLIYRPEETRFMKLVKKAGGAAYNGLKMLLYQGIIAYELWNGVAVSEEAASEILDLLKEKVSVS